MKKLIVLSILFLSIVSCTLISSNAQTAGKVHTPARGSFERAAVLDALQENLLDVQPVIFRVHFLKVHNGWAWIDVTPLNAKTKKPIAEGGPSLVHLDRGVWRVMDLSVVPADPDNPLGAEDNSPVFVQNLQKVFPGVPLDIFPAPSK